MLTALITGAGGGIGKAIGARLLQEGYNIGICGRTERKLEQVKSEWSNLFPDRKIVSFCGDISQPEVAKTFVSACVAEYPQINVLVNNAGSFIPGDIASEPEGRLEQMIAVNLYSAYHTTRATLPHMIGNRAHIFNICSVASLRAYPNGGAYSISKYALLGLTDNLREELRPAGIKVTAICPGATYTPSWEGTGVAPERIMEAGDIAEIIAAGIKLSSAATLEHVVLRPVKGDL